MCKVCEVCGDAPAVRTVNGVHVCRNCAAVVVTDPSAASETLKLANIFASLDRLLVWEEG